MNTAKFPRTAAGAQICRGRLVENQRGIMMLLQKAGSDGFGWSVLRGLLDNRSFALAESQHVDAAGIQNGADAHRDGLIRDVLLAEKGVGGVPTSHRVQRNQARMAVSRRPGLIESDMARSADAEDLNVDATGVANLLFVLSAMILDLLARHLAIRNMRVFRVDIEVTKERLAHEQVVALRLAPRHRVIFVEIECHDAREI